MGRSRVLRGSRGSIGVKHSHFQINHNGSSEGASKSMNPDSAEHDVACTAIGVSVQTACLPVP